MIMQTFEQWYTVCADKVKGEAQTKIIAACIAVLVSGAGFVGYRWYSVSKAQEVQKVLGECLDEYHRAQAQAALWENVSLNFSLGYDHYNASAMAPYFLAGKADAMIMQGKKKEALDVMNALIARVTPAAPLYELYSIKRALMRIDSEDQKDLGLAELKQLASNEKNLHRDRALYYLGFYAWSHDDLVEAKKQWTTLVDLSNNRPEGTPQSPWVALVTERLEQIV